MKGEQFLLQISSDSSNQLYLPIQEVLKEQQREIDRLRARNDALEIRWQTCVEAKDNSAEKSSADWWNSPNLSCAFLILVALIIYLTKFRKVKVGDVLEISPIDSEKEQAKGTKRK